MSFTEQTRHELVERPPARQCCRGAFLSGAVRTGGSLQMRRGGEIAVVLDRVDPAVARLVFQMIRERGADCEIHSFREQRFDRRPRVRLRIHGDRSLQLLHELGVLSTGLTPLETAPRRVRGRACCRGAYLGGCFAVAGSVAEPRRPAHLELRAAGLAAAEEVCAIAAEDGLTMRALPRRGHAIAYAKRRETIHDVLLHLGASHAALSFDEAEVVARTRERANRLTNCDRANLERTGAAAHRQLEAIEQLDLNLLPGPLRELAELRLRHPTSSLAELGRRSRPPLTKSAVARRMRALLAAEAVQ